MRIVTIASLGASAVLGLGALFVAKAVLPNSASARNAAAPQAAGVPMVVLTRDVKYGAKLDAGMLTVVQAPRTVAPRGAFTSVSQVLSADAGGPPVALVPMAAREPLLPTKISGPGARATVAAEIAEGMRAYTIKVTDVSGVGGHALPGDRVDVVLMRDLTPEGRERNYISYVVLQNVRVLGVDLNADPDSTKPASPETATLEVPVPDAQKLAVAATLGHLSLALRRTGEAVVQTAAPIRTGDFLGGGGGGGGGRPRVIRTASRTVNYGPILIIEGQPAKRERARRPARAAAPPVPLFAVPAATPANPA